MAIILGSTRTVFWNDSGLPVSTFRTTQNSRFLKVLLNPLITLNFSQLLSFSIIPAVNPALIISLPLRLFQFSLTRFIFSILSLSSISHTPHHYKWPWKLNTHQPRQPFRLFSHFRPPSLHISTPPSSHSVPRWPCQNSTLLSLQDTSVTSGFHTKVASNAMRLLSLDTHQVSVQHKCNHVLSTMPY